jgi:hypothetical protein
MAINFQPNAPVATPADVMMLPPSQSGGSLLGVLAGLGLGLGTGNWGMFAGQAINALGGGQQAGGAVSNALSSKGSSGSSGSSTDNTEGDNEDPFSGPQPLAATQMTPMLGQPIQMHQQQQAAAMAQQPQAMAMGGAAAPSLFTAPAPSSYINPDKWW